MNNRRRLLLAVTLSLIAVVLLTVLFVSWESGILFWKPAQGNQETETTPGNVLGNIP